MFAMYLLAFVTVAVSFISLNQSRTVHKKLQENQMTIQKLQLQTNQWMSLYQKEKIEHQKSIETLVKQMEHMNTQIKNLEYIVSKMDGREIVRDEEFNIKQIRRVI